MKLDDRSESTGCRSCPSSIFWEWLEETLTAFQSALNLYVRCLHDM